MRIGAAGPHLGRNPDRFHNFLVRGSVPQCRFGMTANAVGTLSDVCHRNGDELLRLRRQLISVSAKSSNAPSANTA
jgi:hypothetical protein